MASAFRIHQSAAAAALVPVAVVLAFVASASSWSASAALAFAWRASVALASAWQASSAA